MRILLDNCLRRDAIGLFAGHEVLHAVDVGWADLKNGDLLRRASEEFDLLVTVDKNMRFQSSLKGLQLSVAVLNVRGNLPEEVELAITSLLKQIRSPHAIYGSVAVQRAARTRQECDV